MFSMTDPIDLRFGCLPWHQSTACCPVVKTLGWVVFMYCIYMRNCTTQIMYGVCRIISHEIGIPHRKQAGFFWNGMGRHLEFGCRCHSFRLSEHDTPRKLTWQWNIFEDVFPLEKWGGFTACHDVSNNPRRVCYWLRGRFFSDGHLKDLLLKKPSECEKRTCHTGMTCQRGRFFFQITMAACGHQIDVVSPIWFSPWSLRKLVCLKNFTML